MTYQTKPLVIVLQSPTQARIYAWAYDHGEPFTVAQAADLMDLNTNLCRQAIRQLSIKGLLMHAGELETGGRKPSWWEAVPPMEVQ